jgi:hypothetical protein
VRRSGRLPIERERRTLDAVGIGLFLRRAID